jgi:hypothetical protein
MLMLSMEKMRRMPAKIAIRSMMRLKIFVSILIIFMVAQVSIRYMFQETNEKPWTEVHGFFG